MANIKALFDDDLPADQRKFLRALLQHLLEVGYDKIHIPCCGQFGIVKVAMEAGYEHKNIFASDISLLSTVMGYLYTGQPLSEIDYELINGEYYEWHKAQVDDVDKAAVLMFIMKICQLNPDVYYINSFREEMILNKEVYKKKYADKLRENIKTYKGINYELMDVRNYTYAEPCPAKMDCVVVMNAPAYSKLNAKMFNFGSIIKFNSQVMEYDFNREWIDGYYRAKEMGLAFIYYTDKTIIKALPQDDVIYAHEDSTDKYSYILMPDTSHIANFDSKYIVKFKNKSAEEITQYKLYPKDRELVMDDVISTHPINAETAIYYRDLFAHRLGATKAEIYYGIFVNGFLMSTCGFNTSFLRRLQETYIFENFCFSISHDKYENLNRLAMSVLVSGQFKKFLENGTLKASSYVDLQSFRTVCLTKYRKSKLNNGLLTLLSSERVEETGTYKLIYEQPFYMDRDYKKCLEIYLNQDMRIKTAYTAANGIELPSLKTKEDDTIQDTGGGKHGRTGGPSEPSTKGRVDSKRGSKRSK